MRDASVSAAANIAEGYGRRTVRDLLHLLYQTRGSLEVECFIYLSHRLRYVDNAERERLAALQGEAARALHGPVRYWEGESVSGRAEIDRSQPVPEPWPLAPVLEAV